MRVISGSARGLKLSSLDGSDTRPTLDRVKEALFSMLTPYLGFSKVLDLFAGSGALGIEALSRGAESAVFVDSLPSAMEIVRENVKKARFDDVSVFCQKDAITYLENARDRFDIIFLDPPYEGSLYTPSLDLILKNNLLNTDGVITMEWDSSCNSPSIPSGFTVIKERRYGRVMLSLLALSEK